MLAFSHLHRLLAGCSALSVLLVIAAPVQAQSFMPSVAFNDADRPVVTIQRKPPLRSSEETSRPLREPAAAHTPDKQDQATHAPQKPHKTVVHRKAVAPSQVQPSGGSMDEALKAAYTTNPAIGAERARLRALDERVPQARALSMPQIGATASYGNKLGDSSISTKASDVNPYAYGLKITQPLFRGFRTLNALDAAEASVMAGRAALADREQTLLLDTVDAYSTVVRERKILKLREDNVRILRSVLSQTQTGFQGGDLTKTDISQAQARLVAGEAELARARAMLAEAENNFERLVGHKPPAKLQEPTVAVSLLPQTKEAALGRAQSVNPKLTQAQYLSKAAEAERKVAQGEFLPTINLEASWQRAHAQQSAVYTETERTVFVRLTAPIFTGGADFSKVREARATETQRKLEAQDAQRLVAAASLSSYDQYLSAVQRIALVQRQVVASQEAAKGTRLEFSINRRKIVDVLNAQDEVVQAKIALESARYEKTIAAYALIANTGTLNARNLRDVGSVKMAESHFYEPRTNYDQVRWGFPRLSNGID